MLGKIVIRLAPVVEPASAAAQTQTTAQNAPQPHPDPLIHRSERRLMTVSKVPKPAPQGLTHVGDNARQRSAILAFGLRSQRFFELLQALRSRPARQVPSPRGLEVIAQEVKAA